MPLSLLAGPANAGKVALLLERYLARLDEEPVLIVPNRADKDRVERELLRRSPCLLGGRIRTFQDVFEGLAMGANPRPVATDLQQEILVRRAIEAVRPRLGDLSRSSEFPGFGDALLGVLGDLEAGLLDPDDLDGELAELYRAYRAELDERDLWDKNTLRRRAVERLSGDLGSWHGEPVFAYGFEDLTGAEWALIEALSGRTDVEVSLPYEVGRAAFASLQRTSDDLSRLSEGRIEELPAGTGEHAAPALAHLERHLFEEGGAQVETGGAVRFLEGAGVRNTLELVGVELLALLREGTAPERVGVIAPSLEPWRAPLDTVFGTLGIPYGLEGPTRLAATPLGQALQGLLRFAWAASGRDDLYTYLRSPYSGLSRGSVDFVEGRLRGRAVHEPTRVEEETERLREAPLVALRELREGESPVAAARALARSMLEKAYNVESPPVSGEARADLRCFGAVTKVLDELEGWERLGGQATEGDVIAALDHAEVRLAAAGEPGRVAILDLRAARTRQFEVVFILGLEEGVLPRRDRSSAFLDDDRRRDLGRRLERPDQVSRDRYLFYTACTRASDRLYLVRESAGDDGSPLEPSPFWSEVTALYDPDDVLRWTRRRALSALVWPIDAAPSERERVRSVARLAADSATLDEAVALAEANDWSRRLLRARNAFERRTVLRNPALLAQLGSRQVFGATELERFGDCSSAWLFERVVDPKTIDAEPDALLRGKVAHQTLYAFYSGLPKEVGSDRVTPETLDAARAFLERCFDDAFRGGVRIDLSDLQAVELRESLWRDLSRFLEDEAASPVGLLPRRFEVGFGTERSAPELQRGIDLGDGLTVSGKIDRIDQDPFSAQGIVQDYKSGKGAFSARQIDEERRLQIPLYMLVLRDLVGVEPLGGVYRALSGARATRGMLREESAGDLPGFVKGDYLDETTFWAHVETARERAHDYAVRMRSGDVHHDPKGGECPSWCDLWTMCRIERP